jgi:hypothetical protein
MNTSSNPPGVAAAAPASLPSSPSTPPQETLEDALKRLARGSHTALDGLLHAVESHELVEATKVTAHCHCLKLDGNGRPRTEDLVNVIAEHVIDYVIPRRAIREAFDDYQRTRSSQKIARLTEQAKALFTDIETSGEGGELLLFALAERLLQLPQLICKMSLKTNTQMHVHGADGLHAGVDPGTGRLLLYWGESKIHADVTAAVRACMASIRPLLTEHSSQQRDLQLLQRHADLDDPALEEALKRHLDPDSVEFNSLEFRGLCLVGFDCDAYPTGPSTTQLADLAKQVATTLPAWRGHLKKRITEENLDAFAMHFLFVPFPSADAFRQLLRARLGLQKQVDAPPAPSAADPLKPAKQRPASTAPTQPPLPGVPHQPKPEGPSFDAP